MQSTDHDVANAVLSIPEEFEQKKLETYSWFPGDGDKLLRSIDKISGNQACTFGIFEEFIAVLKSQLQDKVTYDVSMQHSILEIFSRGT